MENSILCCQRFADTILYNEQFKNAITYDNKYSLLISLRIGQGSAGLHHAWHVFSLWVELLSWWMAGMQTEQTETRNTSHSHWANLAYCHMHIQSVKETHMTKPKANGARKCDSLTVNCGKDGTVIQSPTYAIGFHLASHI